MRGGPDFPKRFQLYSWSVQIFIVKYLQEKENYHKLHRLGGPNMIKKMLAILLSVAMLLGCMAAMAEKNAAFMPPQSGQIPPEMPGGEMDGQRPPDMPGGKMDGQVPPEKPGGEMPLGKPGGAGMGGPPSEYSAVNTLDSDAFIDGVVESSGTKENAVLVTDGTVTVDGAVINRSSDDSARRDASSFYGVGAALLATGGEMKITNSEIHTDSAGGTGVFAYGDGVVYIADSTIATRNNTSGGIHVAGGGTLYARNLTVTTEGESAAAIRSDRGGGTMVVDGGSYTSNGVGSPAVYVTADISIHDAELNATGSEALCLEGLNTVRLYDCTLSGNMQDLSQNDNTWTVIVYQSMSGDSEVGEGHFEMIGGKLASGNGGLFYTTNTDSQFILSGVEIESDQDCEYFLRCTGNANERSWGRSGANGANCTFVADAQQIQNDIIWDSISTLQMYIRNGSILRGAVVQDESCAGAGGEGWCNLYISDDSSWVVDGDSRLSNLYCAGEILDTDGRSAVVISADGRVLRAGDSDYTVTVDTYSDVCDLSGVASLSSWTDHEVRF